LNHEENSKSFFRFVLRHRNNDNFSGTESIVPEQRRAAMRRPRAGLGRGWRWRRVRWPMVKTSNAPGRFLSR